MIISDSVSLDLFPSHANDEECDEFECESSKRCMQLASRILYTQYILHALNLDLMQGKNSCVGGDIKPHDLAISNIPRIRPGFSRAFSKDLSRRALQPGI